MSPFHFARMFKKATGKPLHAYITARRIEHANALLTGKAVAKRRTVAAA